jgi:hypothetical protein
MKDYIHTLWCRMYCFFSILWGKLKCILNIGSSCGEVMYTGELVVTGQGKIEIDLGRHAPKKVKIKFKDECQIIPCNPHHYDELRGKIKNHHHPHRHDRRHDHCNHHDRYVLTIQWHVSNVRIIEWIAYY